MITDNDGGDIAWWPEAGGTERQCANARLMSAAPELLSACEEALAQISIFFDITATDLDKWDSDGSRPKNKLEITLERAINKAKGEINV